jgi:hypothetical protein
MATGSTARIRINNKAARIGRTRHKFVACKRSKIDFFRKCITPQNFVKLIFEQRHCVCVRMRIKKRKRTCLNPTPGLPAAPGPLPTKRAQQTNEIEFISIEHKHAPTEPARRASSGVRAERNMVKLCSLVRSVFAYPIQQRYRILNRTRQ